MAATRRSSSKPRLLAGGNPQVTKAEGDAPVQEYLRAIPGWKRAMCERLDALICQAVPQVSKSVRWNSPMYGLKGQGWFVSFHVFTSFVKLTFFKGTSLQPVPPGGAALEARWINIPEGGLNEEQIVAWVRQASAMPGWGTS